MSIRFEELGWQRTEMGEISLRRRFDLTVRADIYEVKLDDEFLMSSLFTVAEKALATRGLARAAGAELDVVVGGLGLGYTAQAALEDPRIRSLTVIEYSTAVIDWHQRGLLSDVVGLVSDPRVSMVCADFFAAAASPQGFDPNGPGRSYDAVLLDIDHSPRHVLHAPHASFYATPGLRALAAHLAPGGVFAMWSDDTADQEFIDTLATVFVDVDAQRVFFDNPLTGGKSSATIYLASKQR